MKVKLSNVGVIKKCDVEFTPGVNIIIGSSGSGKSTLLKSIRNVVLNDFSDSDISFGKNTMDIIIENNSDVIEYSRSIKSNGNRCYYKVNNETYVKLGRQPLQNVTDVLRVNDVNINGDMINFNFNLQFSSPFLIFDSQSTLYNVLTYRNTFDISSINDYYSIDVKENANELVTQERVKSSLCDTLNSLKEQERNLSTIEQLYSDYVSYKHKVEFLEKLKELHSYLFEIENIKSKLSKIVYTDSAVIAAITKLNLLNEICKYKDTFLYKEKVCKLINARVNIVSNIASAINTLSHNIEFNKLCSKLLQLKDISNSILVLNNCLMKSSSLFNNENLICIISKQTLLLKTYKKCSLFINHLSSVNNNTVNMISDLIYTDNKYSLLKSVNKTIDKLTLSIIDTHNELSKFKICPLCGNALSDECIQ